MVRLLSFSISLPRNIMPSEHIFLILSALFLVLPIILFFLSRQSIQVVFRFFHGIFRNDHLAFYLIAIFFLPGTVIHELSHFFMAIILFLPIHELSIFPQKKGNYLKLGYVLYEKRDVFRGILVGVAPIIVGIGVFWWFEQVHFFTQGSWYIQLIKIYLMFVLSTSMFSSKQDLIDIGYLIPIIILFGITVYILKIDLFYILKNPLIIQKLSQFMYSVIVYIGISIALHSMIVILYYVWNKIWRKG